MRAGPSAEIVDRVQVLGRHFSLAVVGVCCAVLVAPTLAGAHAQDRTSTQATATVRGGVPALQHSRVNRQRERKRSAAAFMRRYYRLVSQHRYATAWGMLSRRVKQDIGSFDSWKLGHRSTLEVAVRSARVRLSGRRAIVRIVVRGRDRDVCDGRVVAQTFRGRWALAPRGDSWVVAREHMRKTGGGTARVVESQCPPPPAPPTPPPPPPPPEPTSADCQGYDPCIAPGPDVDCAGGSGNGPRYVEGPVSVNGSDPYGLDSDGDGLGCED